MRIYKVGGAVRDELLGLPAKDRDWVVVGATPEALEAEGFRRVGRDFPVFIHPRSGEEYSLACRVRGDLSTAGPEVTLEEELRGRDLTVNAMAEDAEGRLIDPYGGRADLQARLLRHVDPATFVQDPLRVLRVARLAARLAPLGFRVADETRVLMTELARTGRLEGLTGERVWQELDLALATPDPVRFFVELVRAQALAPLFPEIDRLFGVPQPLNWHPEFDVGVHTLMVLDVAARLSQAAVVRFAALVHDLGKGTTPAEVLPRHIGHEERGVALIEDLCARLRAPTRYRILGCTVARWHGLVHRAAGLRPKTLLRLLQATGALRDPDRFEGFLTACEADYRGRAGFEGRPYPQADFLRRLRAAVVAVPLPRGESGPQLGRRLRWAQLRAIAAHCGELAPDRL